ncbi:MAG: hypothetical protein PVH98_11705 [Gammaproteobacteria bacterium]|jgi:hypothetical protein
MQQAQQIAAPQITQIAGATDLQNTKPGIKDGFKTEALYNLAA